MRYAASYVLPNGPAKFLLLEAHWQLSQLSGVAFNAKVMTLLCCASCLFLLLISLPSQLTYTCLFFNAKDVRKMNDGVSVLDFSRSPLVRGWIRKRRGLPCSPL